MKTIDTLTTEERNLIEKAFGKGADLEKVITDFNTFIKFDKTTFEDYMNRRAVTRRAIEEDKAKAASMADEAKALLAPLHEKYDYTDSLEALSLIKEAKKLLRTLDNRHLQNAVKNEIRELNVKIRALKSGKPIEDMGTTGPIYDDDSRPTYYDSRMNKI